jgi:DNA-binding transcriptional LysR family regulator
MIDLRRLRAFVAVAEEGHVTRAAERLGMRQPPLTRLIQALEAELGATLLQRLPRGVRPTQAGLALLAEARIVLARAEGVADVVRRAARGEQGSLAVGFTSSAGLHPFVPTVLRKFREKAPGVVVSLEEAGSTELVDAILRERLDAAFVRSEVGDAHGVRLEPVLIEPMAVALPSGHRLATDPSAPLCLTALAGEPFVLYRRPSGPGLYDAILAACRQAGFSPTILQEAPRLPATLSLVEAGLGISLIPASMRRLAGAGVTVRPLAASVDLSAPLRLASRLSNPSPALVRFRNLVRREMKSLASQP